MMRLAIVLGAALGAEAFVARPTPKYMAVTRRPAAAKVNMDMAILPKINKLLKSPVIGGVPIVPVVAGVAVAAPVIKKILDTPSRTYNREENTVGKEYDAWTEEGILEHYWGEHIHLGWYSPQEMKDGYKKKNFIQAKYDFIDRMMAFSGLNALEKSPAKVLDVGCGIGGTSRYLASKLGSDSHVTGITLSPNQVARATALAKERGLDNTEFKVMDALAMKFPDNSFDMVWACESGEHMPDKKKYVEEMARVLKPGGVMVMATWCSRDDTEKPLDEVERKNLNYLESEWTHPHFISIEDYVKHFESTGYLETIHSEDWWECTIASWRHSIWVGVYDPWPVVRRPWVWYKTLRDGICLERFHRSFDTGLMGYGMVRARKSTEGYMVKDVTI
mmetsp:Transcript_916/g.1760  ORF Transcript_916/g.1760 Transcript_916/m.1760 type:complete len:390 (+) Transcript_916:196-1365(+)|eukprot:CAMPEP_0119473698 /NCGR_PEP_ID=MMETSP1344-20130328/5254_1 /TAXON_ID=236787 /ORGANISM="Florenciella parvula, Strain CCMP2471" /LENGTH=389 /DNA_ID=CAMNT_0007506867 /DNA_START=91 /DNA_END=1260 /DNA_ORIENTATION=+